MATLQERRRGLLQMATTASNELSGIWGRVYVERVTAAANSVTNMQTAISNVSALRADKTGVVIFIRRVNADSPSPSNYEFGGMYQRSVTSPQGIRFASNKWNTGVGTGSNYDAHLSEGSQFDVISISQTTSL